MATDEHTLQLSDIIVTPSPTPEPPLDDDDTARDASPEPLADDEIQKMRDSAARVKEKLERGKGKGAGPESELSDMVLRLTSTAISLRTQVLSQADMIANLSTQRKYLLQRMAEDKQLWDGERDDWTRVAEVLVSQANKASPNIYKEQEYGKLPALIESENVTLRSKLANTQGRLTALENELSQLRPILLMQPHALTKARQQHTRDRPTHNADFNIEADATDATEGEPSTPKDRGRQDSQGQYYRPREGEEQEGHHRSKRSKKRSYFKRTPMLTDARAEHLLLAARRIGRRRTSILAASTIQPPEPEASTSVAVSAKGKGRAMESLASSTPSGSFTPNALAVPLPTTPKTPSKSPLRPPYPPGSPRFFAPPGHAYFLPAGTSGSGRPPGGRAAMPAPFYVPGPYTFYGPHAFPGFAPAGTSPSRGTEKQASQSSASASPSKPAEPSTPAGKQQKQTNRNAAATASPLTPFDKLLSAAQTVFSPSATPTTKGKRASAAKAIESAEDPSDGSPTPKRRRLGPETAESAATAAESSSTGLNRRASALDVLADQAIGSEAADARDSRSRSGSVSSVASAVSKGSTVPPPRRTSSRGRGLGPSTRQTRRSKKIDAGKAADEGAGTQSSKGKAKSTARRKGTASRGSSLDPPIRLQDAKSRSRSGTPSTSRRSQLQDIEVGDEDAPHEVDTEDPQFEMQQSRTSVAPISRLQTREKAMNNRRTKPGDNDDDELEPESEEDQGRREEATSTSIETLAANQRITESDEVHRRWLKKLGLTDET